MSKVNKEIASIMRQFPLLYPKDKYNTPQKRFIALEEECARLGFPVSILIVHTRRNGNAKRKGYSYKVSSMYVKDSKVYKSRESAKRLILKLYLNMKANEKG